MTTHPILPGVILEKGFICQPYVRYLRDWREKAINWADNGETAASICHQATLIDLTLDGRPIHDWLSVMDENLMDNDRPIAYSTGFGRRLHKFEGQCMQSTVHSIHTRWWIEKLINPSKVDHTKFAKLILEKRRSDGLIYDADVSETTLRHRMKAELCMSAIMAVEILNEAKQLTDSIRVELATSLADPGKVPPLGYMTCEQFRLAALRMLGYEELFPSGIGEHIDACAEDLEVGWGDFSIKTKVDAYMGTAKRTSRDKQVHSPLVACHVSVLSSIIGDSLHEAKIKKRLDNYRRALSKNPMDIPAFQMRDVPIPFGDDITPIEAVCASWLISTLAEEETV